LSAVARPYELAAFLVPHKGQTTTRLAEIVTAGEGAKADISILKSKAELPSAGHSARYALPEIYEAIKAHRMSLMFVNTRSQAEMLFHELWRYNDANLAIALHRGSLDVAQRRKVEAAMVAGRLRAVVCTLDARSRHRLGRRRSRHQCRCAQGRKPARPAHRPRQSPARSGRSGSAPSSPA